MNKSKNIRNVAIAIAIPVLGIQFVPVERTNPASTAEFHAPAEVTAILKAACFDCHSNETKWPWYSYVAPVSWRVSKHVEEGRAEFNFSNFATLPLGRRAKVWKEVANDKMPMRNYTFMHPESKLTDSQKEILHEWSQSKPVTADATSE